MGIIAIIAAERLNIITRCISGDRPDFSVSACMDAATRAIMVAANRAGARCCGAWRSSASTRCRRTYSAAADSSRRRISTSLLAISSESCPSKASCIMSC